MKPPSVKSVRCAIYTRTADSQITTSSGRWARDIAYATPSRTMMVIAVAPHWTHRGAGGRIGRNCSASLMLK